MWGKDEYLRALPSSFLLRGGSESGHGLGTDGETSSDSVILMLAVNGANWCKRWRYGRARDRVSASTKRSRVLLPCRFSVLLSARRERCFMNYSIATAI